MKRRTVSMLSLAVMCLSATVSLGADVKALEAEFKAACKALLANRVQGTGEDHLGQEGWVVLSSELAYAALGKFWGAEAAAVNPSIDPGIADPVPAIVDFNRQLKERGIRLILLPVPTRPVIYPESVLGKDKLKGFKTTPHLHSPQDEFYTLLRSKGVEVLDPTADFLAARSGAHGGVFIPSESHWTGYGLSLVAQGRPEAGLRHPRLDLDGVVRPHLQGHRREGRPAEAVA
jgi:hypothetical protein